MPCVAGRSAFQAAKAGWSRRDMNQVDPAGPGVENFDLLARMEDDARAGQLSLDADWRLGSMSQPSITASR
jgi:hypothetical protein